jgi:hypothetical protein
MLAVRSLEATVEKYLRNCIRAYFEETQGLQYTLGVIERAMDGGAKAQARLIVETRFSAYAGTERYRELMAQLSQ